MSFLFLFLFFSVFLFSFFCPVLFSCFFLVFSSVFLFRFGAFFFLLCFSLFVFPHLCFSSMGPPCPWTAHNFALFVPLPPQFSFFLLSLGCPFVELWPWPTKNARLGSLRSFCETRRYTPSLLYLESSCDEI